MADLRTRDAIAADYQTARDRGDAAAMRRYQNEEACFALLAILERLSVDERSFVHGIALKGGILMAGELHSARSSADIDATTGRGRRVDPDQVVEDLRRAGRGFGLRLEGEPDWTLGGLIVRFRFDSLTDAGTAKLEVSVREDLVFAVRDALLMSRNGVCGPSRSRRSRRSNSWPRNSGRSSSELSRGDLFDLHLYLVDTGWHLDPAELRRAVDAKLSITRHKRWRSDVWRTNLGEIEAAWDTIMAAWVEPERLPPFRGLVTEVARRLRSLGLD